MDLRHLLNIVWKWTWLALLAVVIAAFSSYLASKAATPLYRTATTLMIGRMIENPEPNTMQLYASQQLAYTYIQLAEREPVLKGAIESLGLTNVNWQSLAGRVSANNIPQTQLLEIKVVDSDPYRAKVLADAIAQQLIQLSPGEVNKDDQDQAIFTKAQIEDLKIKIQESQESQSRLKQELDIATSARQIQELQSQINVLDSKVADWQNTYSQLLLTYQGGNINTLRIIEEASVPSSPFSPNVKMNVLTAAAIGLVLAVAGALLIEFLDDTIKSPEDVTKTTNLVTLGAFPKFSGAEEEGKVIAIKEPLSPIVESFRILAANVQFSTIDKPTRTIMVTSPGPGEGKSTAIANLAAVITQSGQKVILVDADLRRPTLQKLFGISNRRGLTDALVNVIAPQVKASASVNSSGEANPDQLNKLEITSSIDLSPYLQKTSLENLLMMTSGTLPPNPIELLGSESMSRLIEILSSQATMVLFDCAPNLVVADAAVLSSKVDGVILVFDVGNTRAAEARRASEELRRVHARTLGVVLNRVNRKVGGYNYYYHYYKGEEKSARSKPGNPLQGLIGRLAGGHPSGRTPTSTSED